MTKVHDVYDVQIVILLGAMLTLVVIFFIDVTKSVDSMYVNQIVGHMHHKSVLAFEHQQLHCQYTDVSWSLSKLE